MDLSNYEIMPGVIVSVKDDEMLGRIKVSIPGAESMSNCQLEAMPWCYPISMTGTYQGFTKMAVGAKVWVMRNKLDRLEMWYWPMFDLNPNTSTLIANDDNPDVLISRDLGGANVYIYYTDSAGIKMSIGGSFINITPKGSIELESAGGAKINVDGENVFINTESTTNNAVREQSLTTCLNQIYQCLCKLSTAAQPNWQTSHLYTAINEDVRTLGNMISSKSWKSPNIYVG